VYKCQLQSEDAQFTRVDLWSYKCQLQSEDVQCTWSSRNRCYGSRADERGEDSQGGREGCWAGARNLQQREERKIGEQTGHESRRKSQRDGSELGEGLRHFSPHRPVSEGGLRKVHWEGTTLGKLTPITAASSLFNPSEQILMNHHCSD
jgi:hypothetical protein